MDDRRVLERDNLRSEDGLQWKDAPAVYGPPKALYKPVRCAGRAWACSPGSFADLAQPGVGWRNDHDRQHPSQGAPDGG